MKQGHITFFDRAYMDTEQLNAIQQKQSFFVVREKRKMKFHVESDHNNNKSETGVMADQIIRFDGPNPKKQYLSDELPIMIRKVTELSFFTQIT